MLEGSQPKSVFGSYQPSGRDGGPSVGPSWFEGVGGRVIVEGTYVRRKRMDDNEG